MEGLIIGFACLLLALAASMVGVIVLSVVLNAAMTVYAFTGPFPLGLAAVIMVGLIVFFVRRCIIRHTTEYDLLLVAHSVNVDYEEHFSSTTTTFELQFFSAQARLEAAAKYVRGGYSPNSFSHYDVDKISFEDRSVPKEVAFWSWGSNGPLRYPRAFNRAPYPTRPRRPGMVVNSFIYFPSVQ